MTLHSAGHAQGVVCVSHAAADGRAILAAGGDAIEAMLAMAASIAAIEPVNSKRGVSAWRYCCGQ